MANFLPLKRYILYCLDKLIEQYKCQGPFLDIGCGQADLTKHIALKGWGGKGIDFSDYVISDAKKNLEPFPLIRIEKKDLFDENGKYKTIFLLDVLEHIEDDIKVLAKVRSLLDDKGHVIITIPSNPNQWRWDDDFYGHIRRYTPKGITKKLNDAHLHVLKIWDFTFPFFTLGRHIYFLAKKPESLHQNLLDRTKMSSIKNTWKTHFLSDFLSRDSFLWRWIYSIQFKVFKNFLRSGFEIIVLAQKNNP